MYLRKIGSMTVRAIVALFVTMLVTIFSGTQTFAQQASGFSEYPGAALSGLITAQVKMSGERCRKICTERSGCAGFDFSKASGQCRLFGGIASAKDDPSFEAATRYPIPGYRPQEAVPVADTPVAQSEAEPDEVAVARNFKFYTNYDLFGYDLEQMPASSMAQCESLCRDNAECKAFTFNEWNQNCFLKSGIAELRLEPRAKSGVRADQPQPGYREAEIIMEYYRGYRLEGTPTDTRQASSRNGCENMCWDSETCIAFSFVTAQRQCKMYNRASNRFAKSGVESGAKIQPRP